MIARLLAFSIAAGFATAYPAVPATGAEDGGGARKNMPLRVKQVKRIVPELRGEAAVVPIGKAEHDLRAGLYVPSAYDDGRSWPLLVEGTYRNGLQGSLKEFRGHCEKQGFLLLVIEYRYYRSGDPDKVEGWTRDGAREFNYYTRPIPEFAADIAIDERNLAAILDQIRAHYRVEDRAIATTGFLLAGTMAYRLVLSHPDTFCMSIVRTGSFIEELMPASVSRARKRPIHIIFGEKEPKWALKDAEAAITYFRQRKFANMHVERIPNSGVDSRPEIAATSFRGTFEKVLGPEQMAFYRVYTQAVDCLNDADGKDAKKLSGSDLTPTAALTALAGFAKKHPKSAFRAPVEFVKARLYAEKLADQQKAKKALSAFRRRPLLTDPIACRALLYLAENVIDHETDPNEAIRVLTQIIVRPKTPPAMIERARKLRKEIASKREQSRSRG